MKITCIFISCLFICHLAYAQVKRKVTLKELIAYTQESSLDQLIAKSKALEGKNNFIAYKAAITPKITLSGNIANYTNAYLNVTQPDGTIVFQPVSQNYSNLMLSLSQNINYTGGTLTVNTSLARFDDFYFNRNQYNSVPVNISLAQPLLSLNPYKWDKKIEQLKLEGSEKELTAAASKLALSVSRLFFDVIEAQADYELAKKNIESQQAIFDIENKRINLGTTSKEKILQIKLQLINSLQNMETAETELKKSKNNLVNFAGWRDTATFDALLPEVLPDTIFSLPEMLRAAHDNRPEFSEFRWSLIEAEKNLLTAKKERFAANLVASYGLNNVGTGIPEVYNNPNRQQNLSIGLGIPIFDWGKNKAKVGVANASFETLKLNVKLQERNLDQEITNLVMDLALVRSNVRFAKQADEIAQERYSLSVEQFRFGKITITELNIALGEKDNARRSFINLVRTFWQSYYLLKSLTLEK
ncbi:MAG: TolC family protein [Chryseobacterium sp.]|nr:MAG: TolC family protein [Chryseobacterium sp.]